jgi:N-acyl-D-amino-acid deacylase
MARLLGQSLTEGALGMSAGLIYPPSAYGDVDELAHLCGVLGEHDAVFVVHIRSESDHALAALNEVYEACRRGGCRLHVSHLKLAGRRNWGDAPQVLEFLDRSLAAGVETTADQYPYAAGSTMLGAILPPWAHAGGADHVVARLRDPAQRARLRSDMLAPPPHDWDNFWSWGGPEGIVIADIPSGRRAEWVGRDLAAVAGDEARDPLDLALDLLAEENLGVGMISFSQSEEVVDLFAADPRVCGCTDGLLGGKPHPRAYGAFPRILSRYVREGTMTVGTAARKLSGLPAAIFGMKERGLIHPGCHADLTAVDLDRVRDRATYRDPVAYPEGIPMVWVGGGLAVSDGKPTGARGGRVLRGIDRA